MLLIKISEIRVNWATDLVFKGLLIRFPAALATISRECDDVCKILILLRRRATLVPVCFTWLASPESRHLTQRAEFKPRATLRLDREASATGQLCVFRSFVADQKRCVNFFPVGDREAPGWALLCDFM